MSKSEPQIRFKGFNDSWEEKSLIKIAKITMGQSPSSENYTNNPKDYILVQGNADMKNGRVVPRVWTTQVTKLANKGDLILSVRAPVGEVGITDYDVVIGRGVAAIKANQFIYQTFIKMNLSGYWKKLSTGSTFDSVNSSDLKSIKLNIPSLIEQQKIGEFFKQLDVTIELQQQLIDQQQQYKKAMLQKMFPQKGERVPEIRFKGFSGDWEEKTLSEITQRYDNLRVPITASERVEGNTPYYGANGIQDYVDGFTHEGDFILVAEDGANDLKNYPVKFVSGKIWVNNHAHVLSAITKVADNQFLAKAIKNINFEPYLVGGGRAKLNSDVLMKLTILTPKLGEQQKIGAFFKHIDDTIALHQKKLENYQQLKKALLQRMFV